MLADSATIWAAVEAIAVSVTALLSAVLLVSAFKAYSETKRGLKIAADQLGVTGKQLEAALEQLDISLAQLGVDVLTRKADHERRQIETTFHYWMTIQDHGREVWLAILERSGTDEITNAVIDILIRGPRDQTVDAEIRQQNAKVSAAARQYLNDIERLAVCIEKGVMSFDYVDEVGNTIVRTAWMQYLPYIRHVQREHPDGRQYKAFEGLYHDLEATYRVRQGHTPAKPLSYRHELDESGDIRDGQRT